MGECKPLAGGGAVGAGEAGGRDLHLSTFQLNLSRFRHKIPPSQPLISPNTSSPSPKTTPTRTPYPQKALKLS